MHVFVTGATGVLGHRLVERLADRGYQVSGLVRDDEGADLVEARGGTPRRGDVLDQSSLERAIDSDVDCVVHAATAIPTSDKPTDDEWARNDRIRLEGAKNLVAVAGDQIERVLFPSVVWVARPPDGSPFDEESPRRPDRSTRSAAETETFIEEAGTEHDFEVAVLRYGFFYGPDAAHTGKFGEQLLSGDLPVVGGGILGRNDAKLSLVHADDAALAAADAIDAECTGTYHVVDDEPVTVATLFGAFADKLDADRPSRIPGWLAKFFVGKATVTTMTTPMLTTNDRFEAATAWEPQYPTYREGLDQIVETWEADGTLTALRAGESPDAGRSPFVGESA